MLIIYFLSFFVSGWAFLRLFLNKNFGLFTCLGLSFGLGVFLVTTNLFMSVFLLGFEIDLFWQYVVLISEVIVFLSIRKLNFKNYKLLIKNNLAKIKKVEMKSWLLIGMIGLQIIFVTSNAITKPVVHYDSLAIWSLKSKVLYNEQVYMPGEYGLWDLDPGNKLNYPWLLPLAQVWMYEHLGYQSDLWVNLISAMFFVSCLFVLYGFLKLSLGQFRALIFVFLLSSMPLYSYHASNAYADIVISYYLLVVVGSLIVFLSKKENNYLYLSALLSGGMLFSKSEGLIFIIALLIVFLIWSFVRKRIKDFLYFILFLSIFSLPWQYFRVSNQLGLSNMADNSMSLQEGVFSPLIYSYFKTGSFSIWWFIVLGLVIINIRKIYKSEEKWGWLILFFSIGGFWLLYFFTDQSFVVKTYTASLRNILVFLPLSVYLVGRLFKGSVVKINN